MIIGLQYKIPNKYSNYLSYILQEIPLQHYDFFVSEDQVFKKDDDTFLFKNTFYDGSTFTDIIKNNIYYMVFINIKAFPKNSQFVKILNYHDFVESQCQFIILCCDCKFIKIYCKDLNLLHKFYNSALMNGFKEIKYIDYNSSSDNTILTSG